MVVWKLGGLDEPWRPWFRAVFWIGTTALWVVWTRPPRSLAWLGLWPVSWQALALAVAVFAGIGLWSVVRVSLLAAPLHQLSTWPLAAYAGSFAGVLEEELVFRGVLQGDLQSRLPPLPAIGLTLAAFLAIHVPGWLILAIPVGPIQVLTVVLVGLICGVLRYWSGSLWPGVAAHWANNLGAQL